MAKKWPKLKQSRKPHICGIRRLRVKDINYSYKKILDAWLVPGRASVDRNIIVLKIQMEDK